MIERPPLIINHSFTMPFLHIGCGRNIMEGWINLDLVPGEGVDIVADLDDCERTPLPLEDNSIDKFLGSHLLEHIKNPLAMMDELYRVAKPDAELVFKLPYGSSDDAFEDPTHVRQYFLNSFTYFAQPTYWRADYGYRADWQPIGIIIDVDGDKFGDKNDEELLELLHTQRNVAKQATVLLKAIKPAREQRRELMENPAVTFEKTGQSEETTKQSKERKPILEQDHMVLHQCRHGYIISNKHDAVIGRSLQVYGEWCEGELQLLGQLLQPGDVVLDVGAHIGTHTIFFADKVGPEGWVFAFEPQRIPFQTLCANITLNALTNVTALQKAAGAAHGQIATPELDPTVRTNFGAVALKDYSRGIPIDMIPIDSLELDRCNLIKADVEGMERNVLEGAQETIQRCKPILFLENNRSETSGPLLEAVFDAGYMAYWHFTDYFNPENYTGHEKDFVGTAMETNILCVLDEISVAEHMKVTGADDTLENAYQRMVEAERNE
jgi:FkbM family methyltransferase